MLRDEGCSQGAGLSQRIKTVYQANEFQIMAVFNVDLDAISLSRSSEYPLCLLNHEGAEELGRAIEIMKQYPEKGRPMLKRWLWAQKDTPPLEFIWKLNEEEVMFVTTYFYLLPSSVEVLYETFETVYTTVGNSTEKSSACSVIASIIATIVNTLTNYEEEVQTFFRDVAKQIIHCGVKLLDERSMQGCYLSDVFNSVHIFQSCLQEFLLLNLKQLLGYPQPEMDMASVVASHAKQWTTTAMGNAKCLGVETSYFISKILSSLPIEVVIAELKSAASVRPFKWKFFLAVISVLVVEHSESSHVVKSVVDGWLKASLEETDREMLYLAFVTVRHCCAEKTKTFPSYINWFGAAQPTVPQNFIFFYTVLAEMVPFEPPLYLKIHVNKVPTAPPGCQSVLMDYIALAKTRLADLNLTTDYLSIFNEYYDTDEESLAADVAQLLNHFTATNEIAKPVIEASVFRKQYYEKVFLKYLLRVSAREDPVRAKAIKKLHSIGKISSAMFSAWASL